MLDVGIFLTHFSDTYCRFKTYLIKLFHQQRECYFFKKLVLKIYQIWILKFIIINYNCKMLFNICAWPIWTTFSISILQNSRKRTFSGGKENEHWAKTGYRNRLSFLYHLQHGFNLLFYFGTGNIASLTMLITELYVFQTENQGDPRNEVRPLRLTEHPMSFKPVTFYILM